MPLLFSRDTLRPEKYFSGSFRIKRLGKAGLDVNNKIVVKQLTAGV